MLGLAIHTLRANARRLVGTSLAVLCGVAFVTGTNILADTMTNGFDAAYGELNSATDVIVRADSLVDAELTTARAPVPMTLGDSLSRIGGVAAVAPQFEGVAQLLDKDGEPIGGDGPPNIGTNWLPTTLNPFRVVDGREPRTGDEIVVDRATAKGADIRIGSKVTVLVPQPLTFEVTGIAVLDGVDSLGGATFAFFDDATARSLFTGGRDEATGFVVSAERSVDPADLASTLTPSLPDGVEAVTGDELTAEQTDMIDADFLGVLTTAVRLFSGLALLVATFNIYNTFSVLVAQRTREAALLRSIGATRRQVVRLVAIESVVVGAIASIAGVGVGIALASGLLELLRAGGWDLPVDGLTVRPAGLIIGGAVGVASALVAGIVPALAAGRVSPVASMRSAEAESGTVSRTRTVAGLFAVVVGAATIVGAALSGWSPAAAAGGAALLLLGVLLAAPLAVKPIIAVLSLPLVVARGTTGELACENARRSPRRTARTAGALAIGVAVVATFSVLGSSILTSVDDELTGSLDAELVVTVDGFTGAGIDPAFVPAIAQLPDIADVAGLDIGGVRLDGDSFDIVATDPSSLARLVDPRVVSGRIDGLSGDEIAVAASVADDRDWQLGTSIPITFPDGEQGTATIGAVYERAEVLGDVTVPAETWERHRVQPSIDQVVIGLVPGADVEKARAAIDSIGVAHGAPTAMTVDELIDDIGGQIAELVAVINVMLALAIVIAVMGVANTLSLSVVERRRELGVLRAVGQSRRQTRAMLRWEAGLMALLGTVVGLGLGTFTGWGLVTTLSSGDVVTGFSAPVGTLAAIAIAGLVVGVIAGAGPARRAAKAPLLDALVSP